MKGEKSKIMRAMRQKYEEEDEEVSEVSFSVAYERLEDEAFDVSASFPYERLEDILEDNTDKPEEKEKLRLGRRSCGCIYTDLVEKRDKCSIGS